MVSDFIPPQTLLEESRNGGLVCAHMHSITRTQKISTVMSKVGECRQQEHTQHAPSMKTECDCLFGWIRNGQIRKNLTQNDEPQRYIWEYRRRSDCSILWPSDKVSASRARDRSSIPALSVGLFLGSCHISDLNIHTPEATLPGAWCYRVSARTGWLGVSTVFDLQLLSLWQHVHLFEQICL